MEKSATKNQRERGQMTSIERLVDRSKDSNEIEKLTRPSLSLAVNSPSSSVISEISQLDRQSLLIKAVTTSRLFVSLPNGTTITTKATAISPDQIELNSCDISLSELSDEGGTRKQKSSQFLEFKKTFTASPDCVSSDICQRLFSLSEDMNLLVRNITKEAKTLVHAETLVLFFSAVPIKRCRKFTSKRLCLCPMHVYLSSSLV